MTGMAGAPGRRLPIWALLCAGLFCAAPLAAQQITDARYGAETTRYGHAVLGDDVEWGTLVLTLSDGRRITHRLPESRVFEDLAPRLADVDGDGAPEVVVIETDMALGASLAIYDASGKRTATPYIGRTNRWLAPVGVGDLDGDGWIELAYIDRPHLARTLRIWRYRDGALTQIAEHPGLTNHRIGEDYISGGLRDCGTGPEMITTDATWSRLIASRLTSSGIRTRDIGPQTGPASFRAALACD